MFGIGGFELFLILLFGFLIFGPEKLPAIAKTVGQAIGKFRKAQEEMSGTLKAEVFDKDAAEPFKNPLDVIDNAAAKAQKGADTAKKAAVEVSEKAESFAERKARYDRERAERKAAEKKAAEEAAAAVAVDPVVEVAAKSVVEAGDEGACAPAESKDASSNEKGE